jgi:hypothetical protein
VAGQKAEKAGEGAYGGRIWLTTAPNPRRPQLGPDAGQRGWSLHAVEGATEERLRDLRFRPAACGLRPAHGWGVDHYIEDKCRRCLRALEREERNDGRD